MKFFKSFVCLALAMLLALSAVGCGGEAEVALSTENVKIGKGELAYFFAHTVDNATAGFTTAQLAELGLDLDKPLKEQNYDGKNTWFDVFMAGTVEYVKEVLLLCEAARAAGVSLTETDGAEKKLDAFRAECEKKYGVSFEAYLSASFYGYTDEESYRHAVELEMLAQKFIKIRREEIYSSISDGRVAEYIESNGLTVDDTPTRNLMMIYFESDGESRAREFTDSFAPFDSGEFAELAVEHSDSREYLYENCCEGDMSPKINAWLYANARQVGDFGVVVDGDSAFVLYYASEGRTVSDWDAILALAEQDYKAWLGGLEKKFPLNVNEDIINSLDI
ncbi:MAG: hypothetical protein IJX46_02080 [Clostridia bacterium]|nr:hypothetical protein [Clostridia bacterium]